MCGRFAIVSPASELQKAFKLVQKPATPSPNYNAAPGQDLFIIPNILPRAISMFKWGLVPAHSKDASIGRRLTNARAETLWEKNSFKKAIRSRRCLVPANGFYEWKKTTGGKVPFFIRFKDKRLFAFAGLWEYWENGSQPMHTFTIITTEPNDLLGKIHNRMPVIMQPEFWDVWLSDRELSPNDTRDLLRTLDATFLEAFEVSSLVNSVSNNGPELIQKSKPRLMEQTSLF